MPMLVGRAGQLTLGLACSCVQGQQGGGIVGMLKSAVGYGPGDSSTTTTTTPMVGIQHVKGRS